MVLMFKRNAAPWRTHPYWMKFNVQAPCIDTNKRWNFKAETILHVENQYLVKLTLRFNKCCYTTSHGIEQNLNVCLGKSISDCWFAKPKIITSETLTNEIEHMFYWWHIRWIGRPKKKLCWLKEVLKIPRNIWTGVVLLKCSSRSTLKKGNDFEFQNFTDVSVTVIVTHNS